MLKITVGHGRNRAIEQSTGDWICFCDAVRSTIVDINWMDIDDPMIAREIQNLKQFSVVYFACRMISCTHDESLRSIFSQEAIQMR
jgi:hypothetical protein